MPSPDIPPMPPKRPRSGLDAFLSLLRGRRPELLATPKVNAPDAGLGPLEKIAPYPTQD